MQRDDLARPRKAETRSRRRTDETESNDGALDAAMGYVHKTDRRSGLTRGTAAQPEASASASAA